MQHEFAYGVAQAQYCIKVRTRWRYWLSNLDSDGRMSREPLIATQHRSRSTDDPRQDGEICLRGDLERAEIERGQAGPSGEGPLREEDKDATLAR
jgi:hypothetical protein